LEKFIRACVGILPKKLQDIYYKYEEKWMYLFFGVLTTVVSILIKQVMYRSIPGKPGWENTVVVTVSWIGAVTFAFFTNKKYVFKSKAKGSDGFWREAVAFYTSRLSTYGMELALFLIFCDWLNIISNFWMIVISQVLIIVFNYILSKLFVFKNGEKK